MRSWSLPLTALALLFLVLVQHASAAPSMRKGKAQYIPKIYKAASDFDMQELNDLAGHVTQTTQSFSPVTNNIPMSSQAVSAEAAVVSDGAGANFGGLNYQDFRPGNGVDLDPYFSIFDPPQTREYDWTVEYRVGAPDGFQKKQIMINGQTPGPTIEMNEGDTVVIRVNNHLDVGTGIHWHGMSQNSTPWMDGIAGFSQCPIPAGGSFEYRFKVEGQYGTFWYHSHTAVQYTDGLYGALIVHSYRDPYLKGRDYDDERVILIADNYHDFANDIVTQMLSPTGYLGTSVAPSPQSGLINGHGVYNCSATTKTCNQLRYPTMHVDTWQRIRLRIINSGSHAMNHISIDHHNLTIIAADGTAVEPYSVHRVPLHNGQRYDAIFETTQGGPGSSFLLRSTMQTDCFAFVDTTLDPVANMTIQYNPFWEGGRIHPPVPRDWKDALASQCQDLSDDNLVPVQPRFLPDNRDRDAVGVITTQFGFLNVDNTTTLGRFFVNNETYVNFVNKPYLEAVHRGGGIDPKTIASLVVRDGLWISDLIINNNDSVIDHPFHLHGMESHIVARGNGTISVDQWQSMDVNTQNPIRRDTFVIPRSSYAIIRLFTDLPGVWPLHCHIAFHLAGGFMAAIAVHPEKVQQLELPPKVLGLCPTDPASLNITELAR